MGRTDVVELLPAARPPQTCSPTTRDPRLYHCHVADHIYAGTLASFTIHQR
jgi:hypothetical protein